MVQHAMQDGLLRLLGRREPLMDPDLGLCMEL